MKKKKSLRLIALLMAVIMTVCLTACGGSGGQEESSAPDEKQLQETASEETGPKEVSAIDMNVTYGFDSTYYDEEEGYDREYSGTITESSKLVDYKIFPITDPSSSSCIVVMHFKDTLETSFRDAKGNEIGGSVDWLELDHGVSSHEVTNVDTGEMEELADYDSISDYDLDSYYDYYEGLEDYLREAGYEMPSYDDDDSEGIKPYTNADRFYLYRVERAKGTLVYHVENNAIYEDELTVTSYNDAEQIMRIDL